MVREYDRAVVFISNGADDECCVRKQPIAAVQCPLDKRNNYSLTDIWPTECHKRMFTNVSVFNKPLIYNRSLQCQ